MLTKGFKSRIAPIAVLALGIAACGSGQSSNTSTTTSVTVASTVSKDPQIALDALAKSLNAVDYSRISKSQCGRFSLIVEKTRIQFFQWLNNTWENKSTLLGPDSDTEPFLVTTRDYTRDGSYEFLVSYNKDGQQGGHQFGGIFMQIDCQWQWAKFDGYYDTSEVLDLLTYDETTKDLTAWGEGPGGRADVVLVFNSQSNRFDAQTLSADDAEFGTGQPNQDDPVTTSPPNTKSRSSTCVSLRSAYNTGSRTSDAYTFESAMNDAVYILRNVGWGSTADSIVSFTLQGLRSAALGGVANYLRAYNCA